MKLLKLFSATLLMLGSLAVSAQADAPKDNITVGFIYVGPTGDHGWTYRHDIGRQQVEEAYGDRVTTRFVESVAEGADTNGTTGRRHYFCDIIWIYGSNNERSKEVSKRKV